MDQTQRIAALQVEFERLKERADHLDRLLQGHSDAWINIVRLMPSDVAEVTLDKPVAEARQTALAMATIVKALANLTSEEAKPEEMDPLAKILKNKDELAARRAQNTA